MGQLIKENERGQIFAETDDSGKKFIRRIILNGCAEVYKILKDNPYPYIPVIYSVSSDENGVTVTEEYVEGKIISEACFTEKNMITAAKELCRTLTHIHKLGIVHRDIKPSNILMAEDGHIRLIDFDAARTVKPAADSDTRYLGTEGFAPPEQYGFSQTDKRSDIYALRKTLECILGSLAFDKKYADIIYKCTRLDPESRYSDADEVLKDLNGRKEFSAALSFAAIAVVCIISGMFIFRNNFPNDDIPAEPVSVSVVTTFETEASSLVTAEIPKASETTAVSVSASEAESSTTQSETSSEVTSSETLPEASETEAETTVQTALTEAVTASLITAPPVSETTAITEETDPFLKYRSYFKNLDYDKAERIPAEEMEKPLLFETTNDIPMEYIIIDTASLKENKYVSMVYDYNKDGYDDIFQLSAYKPDVQDEYFRSLCVSVVSMLNDYPDFHVISDNDYFSSLFSTYSMNQATGMLYDNSYVQLTVVDINGDERNEIVLSIGKPDLLINTQVFLADNTGLEYSNSAKLVRYAHSMGKVYCDGNRLDDKDKTLSYMDFNNTLGFFKATNLNLYMYEKEDDPLYQFHNSFASRN